MSLISVQSSSKGALFFSSVEAPVIIAQVAEINVNEDESVLLDVSHFTITDLDNTSGFSLFVLAGSNYSFEGNLITPENNWSGVLSVPVQVSDGTSLSNVFTATVTVKPVNDAPVISGQSGVIEMDEDASLALMLTHFNITDTDHTSGFSLVILSGSNYTFTSTTVTPAPNFNGVLSVPVQVSDGTSMSNVFTATITVKPVNDAPVISGQSGVIEMDEDGSLALMLTHFNITDTDHTTGFSLVILSGSNYTFTSTTVTPAPNFNGVLSVPVQVSDGTSMSNVFTATVTVKPVNDAPVISGQSGVIEMNEDGSLALTLTHFNITDTDHTTGFSLVILSGSNYTFTSTTVTPAPNFNGVLSVPVQVSDGTSLSNVFTATVTVKPVNDAPVISGQNGVIEMNEDGSLALTLTHFNITDTDHTTGFSLVILSGSNYTFNSTTVTPAPNFNGVLSVPVQVGDGTSLSNVFTATVTVKPVNDAPVISGQNGVIEMNEDGSLALTLTHFNISDTDHTSGFILVILSGSNYSFTSTTVTPASNFSGVLSVPVQVSDGTSMSNVFTATVTVKPVNDAPVISGQSGVIEMNEDASLALALSHFNVTDVDNTSGFSLVILSGSNYSFTSTTVTPASNFSGVLSVPVQVSDGTSLSNVFTATITVKPVNDAPVINGQNGVIEMNEDGSLALALSHFNITDVDNTTGFSLVILSGSNYTFTSTTVTPASNFSGVLSVPVQVSDGTSLSNVFTATVTVKPVNDAPVISGQSGVIEMNEDGSLALTLNKFNVTDVDQTSGFTLVILPGSNYTFTNTTISPVANFNGVLSVPVQVSDGTSLSNVFTATITVKPVNDAPVISGQNGVIEMNEDGTLALALSHFNVSDTDHTSGFSLVILSGSNYTFTSTTVTPASNFSGVLSVPVQVSDGTSLSNVFTATVTVKPINDAPVISSQNGVIEMNEDGSLAMTLSHFNITDVDNNSGFSLVILSGSNYTFTSTTVTPAPNFSGVLSVPVQVSDGKSLSDVFTATVTVKPVNDAPVISSQNGVIEMNEDGSLAMTLSHFNITDVDNNSGFSLVILSGSNYTFTSTTVTPAPNFSGVLSVPVQVSDGTSLSNVFTATVTVKPVNDAPVISGQSGVIEMNEDGSLALTLNKFNVTDVDQTSGFTLVILPGSNYTFTNTTISPVANFNGELSVSVQVSDGTSLSNVFTATVTVKPVNDAPVISGQSGVIEMNEDGSLTLALSHLNITDTDHTNGFSLVILSGSNYTFNSTTVTPAPNFNGVLSVPVQVSDGTSLSDVFTATVTVKPVNDAPVVVDDLFYTAENTSVNVSVLANDSDWADGINGGINTSSLIITQQPKNGSCVVLANKNVVYTPFPGFLGVDKLVYRVADLGFPLPAIERSATVTIDVSRLSPHAVDDQISTLEDTPVSIRLLGNDVDGDIDPESVIIVDNPQHGTVSVSTVGVVIYTPDRDYNGNDRLSYTVKDFTKLTSNVANVNIVVVPVNDPPQPNADQAYGYPMLPLAVNVAENDFDEESELVVLSVVIVQQPTNGLATVNSKGLVVYTANDQFIGTDYLMYRICDKGGLCGEARLTITVSSANHPPVVNKDLVRLTEDHPVWIDVLNNDTDPENGLLSASLTLIELPSHGMASVDKNTGRIHYVPDADYHGADRLSYQVCDNYFIPLCGTAEVVLTVLPDNDVPVGMNDVYDAFDGVEYRWDLLDNDVDIDGDQLFARISFLPNDNVYAAIGSLGWLTFKAASGYYCRAFQLNYEVCDEGGLCANATLTVNIEALDSDGDGIPDAVEGMGDVDDDLIANYLDDDSDGDGIDDVWEAGVAEICVAMPLDTDDDGVPNYLDVDSDGDGVPDIVEGDEDCDGDKVVNYLDFLDDCQQRVLVPDTFSPNGDGINDFFVIPIVSEFPQNEFVIFNRWGSVVFSKLNYQNSWDGRSESGTMGTNVLPEGTYFYVLKLGESGRMIKGTVYMKK